MQMPQTSVQWKQQNQGGKVKHGPFKFKHLGQFQLILQTIVKKSFSSLLYDI